MHFKHWAVAAAAAAICGSAAAAQATTEFDVLLTIGETCTFSAKSAGDDVNFGSNPRASTSVKYTAQGKLFLDCSEGTVYYIGLNGGKNAGADIADPKPGVRQMSDGTPPPGTPVLVKYDLFQDALHTQFWGNNKTNGKPGTGTGKPVEIPVFGLVTNANVAAGTYTDRVMATVVY